MFRELAKKNKQIDYSDCIRLLHETKRGVLSVLGDDGYPYGTPMNHFYCEDDGCIYFHCGRQRSHRLDALKKDDKVSFCVYSDGQYDEYGDPCGNTKWALTIESVVVFGRMEIIDDLNEVQDICTRLCRKFTHDEDYIESEINTYSSYTLLLRLNPEHICGKKVKEA